MSETIGVDFEVGLFEFSNDQLSEPGLGLPEGPPVPLGRRIPVYVGLKDELIYREPGPDRQLIGELQSVSPNSVFVYMNTHLVNPPSPLLFHASD